MEKEKIEITELQEKREYKIVKRNDLIQKSRYNLSTQEQKIILYLISKIKPEDTELKLYEFQIKDFCEVCGIDTTSGKNYALLKDTIKNLTDKSVWVTLDNGDETVVRWIEKPYLNKKSGTIKIKLDKDMKPYLLHLKEKFTKYSLYFTLAMKSRYSIRLYEILKSYQYKNECEFEIEHLKKMLSAETYKLFGHFKEKVLEIAMREINDYGDISVKYELERQGRKFHKIKFKMALKYDIDESIKTFKRIDRVINKQ